MSDIVLPLQVPPRPDTGTVLRGVAWSFFLFGTVLAILLALSYALLLPRFSRVQVSGVLRDPAGLRAYGAALQADLDGQERERELSVLPLYDPFYEQVKEARRALPSLDDLRADILHSASALTSQTDAVVVREFRLREGKTLDIAGDVRNVGPRSMTVLAQFVGELRKLPWVASFRDPPFQRLDEPGVGIHSPFALSLHLR